MKCDKSARINGSGCYDPTAGIAIENEMKEYGRFRKLLDAIFTICELSGYHLEGRITVKDVKTGRIWR